MQRLLGPRALLYPLRKFSGSALLSGESSVTKAVTLGHHDSHDDAVKLAPGVFTSHKPPPHETIDEVEARFVAFFEHQKLDGWLLRKGINDITGHDLIPNPRMITAVLRQCRKQNDHSLAVRFLELVKFKCGSREKVVYPWLLQQVQPVLAELGVSTPEQLGYEHPELWHPYPDDV